MGNSANRDADAAEVAELASKALECRKRGLSYRAAAAELGISKSWAQELAVRAIADIPKENAESVLAIELERLDAREEQLAKLREHFMPIAMLGCEVVLDEDRGPIYVLPETTRNAAAAVIKACEASNKIQERRAKYLGLDAPERAELTGKDGAPLNGPVIYVPTESDDE